MSRNLNNQAIHRDYGATQTGSSTAISGIPGVSFSGFSPTEFMSLSEGIAHNINCVKSSWKQLEKSLKIIGTHRDTQAMRSKVHNIQKETNARIQTTSKDLQRLTPIVRREDKQQKLQLEKLTTDFRNVVEKYSASQQLIATAMKRGFLQSERAQQQNGPSDLSNMTAEIRADFVQQQKLLQAGLQFEQDLLVDREKQIKQIEADILDVNAIMKAVSSILQPQGEQIDLIENSIDNTCVEVERGTSEIVKAAVRRRSYRRKMLTLLAIAVIIGLIVTGVIVVKLNS